MWYQASPTASTAWGGPGVLRISGRCPACLAASFLFLHISISRWGWTDGNGAAAACRTRMVCVMFACPCQEFSGRERSDVSNKKKPSAKVVKGVANLPPILSCPSSFLTHNLSLSLQELSCCRIGAWNCKHLEWMVVVWPAGALGSRTQLPRSIGGGPRQCVAWCPFACGRTQVPAGTTWGTPRFPQKITH